MYPSTPPISPVLPPDLLLQLYIYIHVHLAVLIPSPALQHVCVGDHAGVPRAEAYSFHTAMVVNIVWCYVGCNIVIWDGIDMYVGIEGGIDTVGVQWHWHFIDTVFQSTPALHLVVETLDACVPEPYS